MARVVSLIFSGVRGVASFIGGLFAALGIALLVVICLVLAAANAFAGMYGAKHLADWAYNPVVHPTANLVCWCVVAGGVWMGTAAVILLVVFGHRLKWH